ncbi:hypothetical protein [Virgibacillus oceani]|uniref:Uncharacterized protein n=1 Tax=Virgibacillus oceani TaxID=1479511 RepID=A0A917HCD0_9BACI|nr:hypothetical protein [Virgibacillus oceani]GGG74526.1 hypothetical protein GCM10011398_19020 [Virgibacillus oceani]
MDKKKLCNLVLFLAFSIVILSQPFQIVSQINVSQVDQPTVKSAGFISDVDAAHITSPLNLPNHDEHKSDPIIPPVKKVVCLTASIPYQFSFVRNTTESAGFLDVKKYQSNYLS